MLSEENLTLLITQSLLGLVMDSEELRNFLLEFPLREGVKGTRVFNEGDASSNLIILVEGKLDLFSKSPGVEHISMGSLQPGRSANLYALIRQLPFQYSAELTEDSKYLQIPWKNIEPILLRNPSTLTYFKLITESPVIRSMSKEIGEIGCTPRFRVEFLGNVQALKIQTHSWVLHQAQIPRFSFMLINGTLQSYQKPNEGNIASLCQVPARSWLGWLEAIDGKPSSYSFRSNGDSELIQISSQALEKLRLKFPEDFAIYTDWIRKAVSANILAQDSNTEETVDVDELFPVHSKRKWFTGFSYPWIAQENEMDCGPACLAMISRYYENEVPIQFWRNQIYTNREGTSLFDLAQGAERNGFTTHGLYVEDLNEIGAAQLPAIVVRQYHYVVVYKVNTDSVIIGDPSIGIRKVPLKEFYNGFEKAALLLRPTEDFYKIKAPKTSYGHYLNLFKGYTRELSLVLICSIIQVMFSLFSPFLMQIIMDEVIAKKDFSLLLFALGTVATVTVLQAGMSWLRNYYVTFLMSKFDFRSASAFLRKMFSLPYGYFANRHVGDFTRRLSEMERLREFLTTNAISTFLNFLTLVIYGAVLFSYSPIIAGLTFAVAPMLVGISMLFTKKLQSSYMEAFSSRAEQESLLNDLIRGVTAIKSLGAEVGARWRLEEKIVNTLKSRHRFSLVSASLGSVSDAYSQLIRLGLMGFAAYLAIRGGLSAGQVVSVSVIVNFVIEPFYGLSRTWASLQELKSAMTKLNDVFLSPSESTSRGSLAKERLRGDIEFQDVWFRYGGDSTDWVLKGVSFKIEAGQKIAIAGPSGSGKSTISNLLLRLFEPTQGQILIDGRDYREYDLHWLRSQMGMILQDSHLFNGTITDNIAFGHPQVDETLLRRSAKMANAHDFIMKKPSGYSYVISHGGFGLSGGEKQRISCARAFYLNPAVLILDEATSALDGVAEKDLLNGLLNASGERTVLSIAHRYTTARFFDQVLLMNSGKVVGFGGHDYLRRESELYRALFGMGEQEAA